MKLKVIGMIAGLAWGGAALAQGSQEPAMPPEPSTPREPSMPQDPSMQHPPSSGSEMSGGMGGSQMQGQQELSGSVVAMRKDKLYIKDENGAVVPVGVNHSTQIDGKTIEKHRDIHSHLRREIKEGDQVRTKFNVEKTTENMASSIEKMSK
ncbi:hypothetical protein [Myxococcus xanthus]|uniref:hypothetical protein n=1 Tax=Myxococcus xanthus TaxID=34 RepID=UPI001128BB1F|nr:hypothetical protein [Myxococcus xanthus]QDE96293.1 hypothetical protein BHS05_10805 [Myxococcus xanthus]QDF03750.1 hypothetical protein BHS04_11145 [Myxococcus xanthus]